MKKLLSVKYSSKNADIILLIARIGIGAMMLTHGLSKIPKLSEEQVQFMNFLGLGPEISLWLAVLAEVGCSLLVLVGLGTRLAVIPLIITMLVAVFVVHGEDPFARQEMGLHYLLVYVMLFIGGSGRYSLDRLLESNAATKQLKGQPA